MLDEQKVKYEGLIRLCAKRGTARYTSFLEPPEAEWLRAMAAREGLETSFFGGYEGAERVMGHIGEGECVWDIAVLRVQWDGRFSEVGHRDILGALMALGLERDTFGDILNGRDEAYIFVQSAQSGYVADNLTQAGRAELSVSAAEDISSVLPKSASREVKTTVMSLRLDAVLSSAFALSRDKAASAIRAGLVKLNYVQCLKADSRVNEADIISFRGHGRAELTQIGGESKKGRTFIKITVH